MKNLIYNYFSCFRVRNYYEWRFLCSANTYYPRTSGYRIKNHANGFLRYNNINDLAHSGPQALTWFLNRANTLFKSNYPSALPTASLQLSYLSVFCRAEHEADSQALPVYDFLKIDIQPTGKSGYGVMFSSQMREYYRDRLENGMDTSEIPVDQAFFNSIFKQDSPKTGVLESYPVIMIPVAQMSKLLRLRIPISAAWGWIPGMSSRLRRLILSGFTSNRILPRRIPKSSRQSQPAGRRCLKSYARTFIRWISRICRVLTWRT